MKSGKILVFIICSLFLISACQEREKNQNGDFSGVGNLIAERNKARQGLAKKTSPEEDDLKKATSAKSRSTSKTDELASIILYEQNVKIVGTDSGRTLANGIAYVNKKGQIVRITIIKE